MSVRTEINGNDITLTNLGKELWPGEGIKKYDLIKYYLEIAPYLLPHLSGRFLVIQRFPDGIGKDGFYQKNIPFEVPSWIKTAPFQHGEKITRYLLAEDPATLAWLGNNACVEIHPWLSSLSNPELPDYAVFDLDRPAELPFHYVCELALDLNKLLQKKGLQAYPKTSGAYGLQVYLPLQPRYTYAEAREFCYGVFRELHKIKPQITTLERRVTQRGNKIYLDYLQNARGKTLVAPYSPRPLPGAPVSTPLAWQELSDSSLHPSLFNIFTILKRLQVKGDLFVPVLNDKQLIK